MKQEVKEPKKFGDYFKDKHYREGIKLGGKYGSQAVLMKRFAEIKLKPGTDPDGKLQKALTHTFSEKAKLGNKLYEAHKQRPRHYGKMFLETPEKYGDMIENAVNKVHTSSVKKHGTFADIVDGKVVWVKRHGKESKIAAIMEDY